MQVRFNCRTTSEILIFPHIWTTCFSTILTSDFHIGMKNWQNFKLCVQNLRKGGVIKGNYPKRLIITKIIWCLFPFSYHDWGETHVVGFLHLKECEAFASFKKRVNPLLPKILAGKVRRVYADPMHKSIEEMNRDLEVVYVGQMCLSWEILWWLDARTRELLDYEEVEGSHSYNHAFEEFQQFQVLVQRFMEDELFKGRRHENYVKSRSIIRSLLQVPIIKGIKNQGIVFHFIKVYILR